MRVFQLCDGVRTSMAKSVGLGAIFAIAIVLLGCATGSAQTKTGEKVEQIPLANSDFPISAAAIVPALAFRASTALPG
jgi:hypothetical protein